MRLLLSFAAVFLSVVLLQFGSGGLGPLDALSGIELDFTSAEVGLLGSAHFFGFFIGCWMAPRLLGAVGHSRSFAAFTATGTIGIIAHTVTTEPYLWAVFRVLSGICIAGSYTIIESWLQAKVTNETRGRAMGVYRVVDVIGSLGAQLLIGVLDPVSYLSYNILAILCCAALLPIAVTRVAQPVVPAAPRLRPRLAWIKSPLAAVGVAIAGLTGSAFRMVGPLYGVEVGLSADQIALFLAAFVLGGAVGQYPTGWLADKFDRRWVLIWLSVAAILSSAVMIAVVGSGPQAGMWAAGLFGLTTFPIYSVSTAHAHDFAEPDERVDLSAALMFLFALGAIVSPYGVSILIDLFQPAAMFLFISAAHVALIVFGLLRMRARPTEAERTPYVYAPRTTFLIGRLLRRDRDGRG